MRNLPLPRQRLLNASLVAAFGTATALWGLCAAAQTADAPPAGTAPVTGQSGQTLPPVTVNSETESSATSRVNGYVAKRSATGTKTDTPIIETPQSISVVTADRISSLGVTRLSDALAYTAGVKMLDGLDSRFDWLTLGGFDAYSPGFYLDGMQVRNNSNYAVWRLEGYGAERIEVLRGPSSVLYGQTGPGGMINVVSKRPTEERLREIQVQVGNHSQKQIAADFSGPIDAEGKLLYRLTALGLDSNTQVNYAADKRQYFAPSLTWRPSSDTSITLMAHYTNYKVGNTYGFLPPQASLLASPNGRIATSTFLGEPDFDRFNQKQWDVGYQLESRLNDTITIRQSARYGKIKTDYRQIYGGGFATLDPENPFSPLNYRVVNRQLFASSPEQGDLFTMDNQIQAKLKAGSWQHTLLAGLDHQRSSFDTVQYYGAGPQLDVFAPVYGAPFELPATPSTNSYVRLVQTGFYLQDQIKWGDRWVATLGGRWDRASVFSINRLDDNSTSYQVDRKFTGRAGLVYLAPNGIAPYVSYSESFSPSTFINPDTKKPFQPETGKQYEVGVRYQPTGTKSSYSAALFDLRRKNIVTFDSDFVPRQTGEVRVRGLELEATFEPVKNLNLVAAYTYTPSAKITADANPEKIGRQLIATPRNQIAIWGDYRFGNGVKTGLGVRFVGSTWGANSSSIAKIPSYTVVDAMVGYDFENWSLALNVRNLTDKIYVGRSCDQYSCGYGERRKVVGTATYRW